MKTQVTQQPTKARATSYLARVQRRLATEATRTLFRRRLSVRTPLPLISFTFDDFPRSALFEAGSILMRYGALGTYYASLGLMGKPSPVGPIYEVEDLTELVSQGHELGCHTFGHAHSWNTPPDAYEKSIVENQQALNAVLPGVSFQTFAYPHSAPRLAVKRVAGSHFKCCRAGGLKAGRYVHRHSAGGQTFNSGVIDLNCLCAFFLEKSRNDPNAVKTLINQNARARGWLILATHDVCVNPGPFGCTPDFFERVVQWSVESGARILPVVKALEVIKSSQPT
ncbi:MAG TPA: polysaccharide deacetylase family protein [Terriglobales bacterium]|nr:polysaccharide deacetylase family protein [Terriglobales bacterium]